MVCSLLQRCAACFSSVQPASVMCSLLQRCAASFRDVQPASVICSLLQWFAARLSCMRPVFQRSASHFNGTMQLASAVGRVLPWCAACFIDVPHSSAVCRPLWCWYLISVVFSLLQWCTASFSSVQPASARVNNKIKHSLQSSNKIYGS